MLATVKLFKMILGKDAGKENQSVQSKAEIKKKGLFQNCLILLKACLLNRHLLIHNEKGLFDILYWQAKY
jgi:hypothetical protein